VPENLPFFTVSRISDIIKNTIEQTFPVVSILGEVSNLSITPKYAFFSLKDDEALIKCVCWSPSKEVCGVLKNGEKLIATGKITAYKNGSYYQLTAYKVKYHGVGEIANQFEFLKNKLQKEGIFDAIHKKPLPKFVQNIAVISAKNSAAIEDIFTTLKSTIVQKTYFIPAIMQGSACVSSVISALQIAQNLPVDAILIARGGGSLEDLSQFNSEELAREVFAAKIPIISAIGHEIDFTILDFIADFRAPTPTYGAQMIAPQKNEVCQKIRAIESTISQKTQFEIAQCRNTVENIEYKMQNLAEMILQNAKRRLENAENALNIRNFLTKVREYRNRILILEQKIEQINPKKALKMGFVMLKSGDGFENNPQKLPENFEVITHFGNFPAKKRNP